MLKAMASANIVRVSYKGAGQARSNLLSGQVALAFPFMGDSPDQLFARVKADMLRNKIVIDSGGYAAIE
jgi:tripartite-type tricarboxylate transporter receptor subunit TctC